MVLWIQEFFDMHLYTLKSNFTVDTLRLNLLGSCYSQEMDYCSCQPTSCFFTTWNGQYTLKQTPRGINFLHYFTGQRSNFRLYSVLILNNPSIFNYILYERENHFVWLNCLDTFVLWKPKGNGNSLKGEDGQKPCQ